MSAPEDDPVTSRGDERLSDLRRAAELWGGWLPAEVIEGEASSSEGLDSGQESTVSPDAGKVA